MLTQAKCAIRAQPPFSLAGEEERQTVMDYRDTLNLPQTGFRMKAGLVQREPEAIAAWERDGLYEKVMAHTASRPLYILHDGPPYANGHIHMGHALNKVLKDVILRAKRMSGFSCPYVPGWDCHGLPIEHKVDKELGPKKKEISTLEFREACRSYARKWIDIQREGFRRLGILGDWQRPYLTIDYEYEAAIAAEFNRFLESGAVVRSRKPVYWCTSCRTALAEAEVEYHDHASPSIYVKFPFAGDAAEIDPALAGRKAFFVIWTTTPWTLPANLAIALHPGYEYAAVEVDGEVFVMADGLVEQALAAFGKSGEVLARFASAPLEGKKCRHPFMDRDSLIVLADYVTLDSGTGCVHTAPGHGREDHITGLRYGLEPLSPVDDRGFFTSEAGPYAGIRITEANRRIIDDLAEKNLLVAESRIEHSYPHCWRCKNPVIFRATEQWFVSMEKNDLRSRALEEIGKVKWLPAWGEERIHGMVKTRPDWCLSRQRAWGVPITAFVCRGCGAVCNTPEINRRVEEAFRREGADAWFAHEPAFFLGDGAKCPACGSTDIGRETDILDVWFDSGVSHAAVLEQREGLSSPADLYLEGSDQHRGWFQSSLLASVGTRGRAPYKGVLTHGFVVDGKGKKMSKSLGNVIAPDKIIKKYGAEILRLWVVSEDYRDDIRLSDDILRQLSDAYRKIRNTFRFMLGNLGGFDPARPVPVAEMGELDRWALRRYELLKRKVLAAYDSFEFHTVYHAIYNFCTVDLSSLYLDVVKDRLYASHPDDPARRAAQTVIYTMIDGILRLCAPVLVFTASEAWEFLPPLEGREEDVVFAAFPEPDDFLLAEDLAERWERLLGLRSAFTRALEAARAEKRIGHPLEARVVVECSGGDGEFIAANLELIKTLIIVSELECGAVSGDNVREDESGLRILVEPAPGGKCERCWTRSRSVGDDREHPDLCGRCAAVVKSL